jgi:hypothetical protein
MSKFAPTNRNEIREQLARAATPKQYPDPARESNSLQERVKMTNEIRARLTRGMSRSDRASR